ncbi:MAG: sugar ABC transporter ATP-binding protein [Anaerolineae bacterium]|nr:sugar ABC transporter ATP-binding protein [Anaerolineae bacterium]
MMSEPETPLLEARGISKTFNGVVRALDGVNLAVRRGEIVGVVGENGAGKSTLMKILVGVYPPDEGTLFYLGKRIPFPRNPKEAARRGVSIVYQERGIIPHLRVYQYLFLGHEARYTKLLRLQTKEMKKQAEEVLKEFHIECDAGCLMGDLSLSLQKMVEIARAILTVRLEVGNNDVTPIIILDEPTAPLTVEEREKLFQDLLPMKSGASFIFVSHIIPEVMRFADRVYVLREGRLVGHYDLSQERVTEEDLFRAIVGRESSEYLRKPTLEREVVSDEIILSAVGLTRNGCYYDVSFDLHKGECIGLFGPAGSGKSEILRTLGGLLSFDRGSLTIKKQIAKPNEMPPIRLCRGIGYFSGETGKELFLNWPVAKNISIVNLEKVLRRILPVIHFGAERRMAERVAQKLRIRVPHVHVDCYSLSGGNKQKVSVGRWLERNPEILLLEDPTVGIDVGAREDIYEALLTMKRAGLAMILVSDDPKEYSILCDRVMFIRDGRVQETMNAEEFRKIMGVG